MMTDAQRFGVDLGPLNTEFDAGLIIELITLYAEHAQRDEYRLMGGDFLALLRLIRANPVRLFETEAEVIDYNENERRQAIGYTGTGTIRDNWRLTWWLPNRERGLRMRLSSRHPLSKMLTMYCPPDHAVWRYITVYKV